MKPFSIHCGKVQFELNEKTWRETIYPILILSIIALVVSLALAVTNMFTAPVIAENDRIATLGAYVEVMPSISDAAELESLNYTSDGIEGVVRAPDGSIGVKAIQPGYDGGDLILIVGFDATGKVSGLWVDASTQTAGIGSRVAEDSFTATFLGLDGTAEAVPGENGVDTLAGATVSSKAFFAAYNNCVNAYNAAGAL